MISLYVILFLILLSNLYELYIIQFYKYHTFAVNKATPIYVKVGKAQNKKALIHTF